MRVPVPVRVEAMVLIAAAGLGVTVRGVNGFSLQGNAKTLARARSCCSREPVDFIRLHKIATVLAPLPKSAHPGEEGLGGDLERRR